LVSGQLEIGTRSVRDWHQVS